jgi:hypothetical protein
MPLVVVIVAAGLKSRPFKPAITRPTEAPRFKTGSVNVIKQ